MINLADSFKKRMISILGDEYALYEDSLSDEAIKGFRVNTDKISLKEFEKINVFGNEKIPYIENGFYLNFKKIGNHPFHHAGMFYVQEPAAMAPAECINIEKDWNILDMCAAPGGKSTQLKNKMGENAVLVSNEKIPSRCKILTGNIERLGLNNTVTTCFDTKRLAKIFPETFDLIMVDAPCSGEGMFRKEEQSLSDWSEENVISCSRRQSEILENAVKCLKKGGYIIYATCTFSLEENEMTVDSFLQKHPDFEIVKVNENVQKHSEDGIFFKGCKTKNINYARRFYPHKNRGEGQFVAVLKNKNLPSATKKMNYLPKNTNKLVVDFLDDTLIEYKKDFLLNYKNNPIYFNPNFEIPESIAFSCGIKIGEIRKNYILPHHQFFMAMGKYFKRKIELSADSTEIQKYLHGEEITTNCDNGWAVVTVNGCSVGGAKVVSGIAKNHYPKGLRIF